MRQPATHVYGVRPTADDRTGTQHRCPNRRPPRDTDVSWSLRNTEAGRLADDQSKTREEIMKMYLVALAGLTFATLLFSGCANGDFIYTFVDHCKLLSLQGFDL
jgi:hypothetical protein